jgi:putative transposase
MVGALNGYAQSFLERHQGSEELWHRRCHASVIQPRYLWDAIRYVERNPVRARIVSRAQDYPWSSAAYHCGLLDRDPLVGPGSPLKGTLADWSSWLGAPDRTPELVYLRRKQLRSAPHRHPEFIGLFERDLDRRISRFERIRDRPMG